MPFIYPDSVPSVRSFFDLYNLYDIILFQRKGIGIYNQVRLIERFTCHPYPWCEGYSTFFFENEGAAYYEENGSQTGGKVCTFTIPATDKSERIIVTWLDIGKHDVPILRWDNTADIEIRESLLIEPYPKDIVESISEWYTIQAVPISDPFFAGGEKMQNVELRQRRDINFQQNPISQREFRIVNDTIPFNDLPIDFREQGYFGFGVPSAAYKNYAIFTTKNEPQTVTLRNMYPETKEEYNNPDFGISQVAWHTVVFTKPDDVVITIDSRFLWENVPSPTPERYDDITTISYTAYRDYEENPNSYQFSFFDLKDFFDPVDLSPDEFNDWYNFNAPLISGCQFAVIKDLVTTATATMTATATYGSAIFYARQEIEPFKSQNPNRSDSMQGVLDLNLLLTQSFFSNISLANIIFPPSNVIAVGGIGAYRGRFQAQKINYSQAPPTLQLYNLDEFLANYNIAIPSDLSLFPLIFNNNLEDPMANQDLMIQEIHACLGASEFAYSDNKADPPIPVYMHIARKVDYIAKALGVNFDLTGKIMSVRPSKHLNQGDVIPAGWSIGQFGRNEGASPVGQTGGLQDEERLGIVYEVKGNRFDTNQASGAQEIVDGGYILCESLTQYWHIMLQDLDRSLGLQTLGSYAIANPNYNPDYSGNNPEITTPYYTYNGLGDGMIELIYTLADTNRHALQANIGSLKSQAISQEVLGALGVPVLEKSLKVEVDSESATIKYPGFNGSAQTIADILFLGLMNLALQNER
jgi:hypothetical protein